VSYRWVDHTAEVELEIDADSERGVLEDALRALAELLGVDGPSRHADTPGDVRSVAVEAGDRPALLAAWLEELVFLAESEGFVATHLLDLDLAATNLRATVSGVLDEPPPLVKAVTYHRLSFEPAEAGYVARVVLDV
jgi:SHS2 domain-containing protein